MTPLESLAVRASADPFFLGHRLARVCEARCIDDGTLCRLLGCGPGVLATLRLCRQPADRGECDRIAGRLGVSADTLAGLLGL